MSEGIFCCQNLEVGGYQGFCVTSYPSRIAPTAEHSSPNINSAVAEKPCLRVRQEGDKVHAQRNGQWVECDEPGERRGKKNRGACGRDGAWGTQGGQREPWRGSLMTIWDLRSVQNSGQMQGSWLQERGRKLPEQ